MPSAARIIHICKFRLFLLSILGPSDDDDEIFLILWIFFFSIFFMHSVFDVLRRSMSFFFLFSSSSSYSRCSRVCVFYNLTTWHFSIFYFFITFFSLCAVFFALTFLELGPAIAIFFFDDLSRARGVSVLS